MGRCLLSGLTDSKARTLTVPLDFLKGAGPGSGGCRAEIYADSPESADNVEKLSEVTRKVDLTDTLTITMASAGNVAERFVPVH